MLTSACWPTEARVIDFTDSLLARIRDQILEQGPLRFDEYVDICLYDPTGGFYSRKGAVGRRGDFLTSPEIGPLFGTVLARWIDKTWQRLGCPVDFLAVEVGAGRGTLARSILAAEPEFLISGRYLAVERSEALREDHPKGVESMHDLPSRSFKGVVFANELLDNLAFRLLEASGLSWRELLVGVEGESLVEIMGDVVHVPDLSTAVDGVRIPLQEQAADWVERVLGLIEEGELLLFDYVSTMEELTERPWGDWLRTYQNHNRAGHPFHAPGTQDITVEVAVDRLPGQPEIVRQADFLRLHGIENLVDEGRWFSVEGAFRGDLSALRARSRIAESEALLDETGLGAFAALSWKVDVSAFNETR